MKKITNINDLPFCLNAGDVASVLGISRANAYNLMNSESFPSIRIGERRLVVPREKLTDWIDSQSGKAV